ncbi:DUF6049 family protein [Nocardioides houyundeii]|uniref:DUF6049 family protein n=1 Tax=Nocardioides houyundeii TaxID=2045452 RepID=UPI0013B3D75A|nr:DUF6049 family protein [Nocardioides houyundeii]
MPRRSSLSPALAALATLGVLVGLLTATPASAAPTPAPQESEALRLELESLTPSVLTDAREVRMSGSITNDSDETWTSINVMPFRSLTPITDGGTLSAAADVPVDEIVGERILTEGAYDNVEVLEPGESEQFEVTIPAGQLDYGDGVYWVGVHASGETETQPRDDYTDGRARTFMPVVSSPKRSLPAALVLPLRSSLHHDAQGRVANPAAWARRLSPGGRLHNLLLAGREAGARPVTWLVDPAIPLAASRLAQGNPPTSITPSQTAEEESGTPTPAPSAPAEADPGEEPTEAEQAAAMAAEEWLRMFSEEMGSHPVLALPYGDVDASALQRTDPEMLEQAVARSAEVMSVLGVVSTPVLASPDGFLSPATVSAAGEDTLVLLNDKALDPAVIGGAVPSTGEILGHTFATTSSGVAEGGPGPESPSGPIAVRQRVVSEAALRLINDDRSPLVIAPPPNWDPATGSAELYSTFDDGLMRLRPLGELVRKGSSPGRGATGRSLAPDPSVPDDALVYGEAQRRAELPTSNVHAAARMVETSKLLESVLTRDSTVVSQTRDVADADVSYFARRRPAVYRSRSTQGRDHLKRLLGSVRIDGPPDVILSSNNGQVGVSLVNDLPVPVTVRIEARSTGTMKVSEQPPVTLAPTSRQQLRYSVSAADQGIESLTLRLTDADGVPIGSSTTFPVRTSQVSGILWVLMAGGALLLFGAIGVRLLRRVLRSRRDPAPETDVQPEHDDILEPEHAE